MRGTCIGRSPFADEAGKSPLLGRPSDSSAQASSSFRHAIAQGLSSENAASERHPQAIGTRCSAMLGCLPIDLNPPSAVSCPFLSGEEITILWPRNLEFRAMPVRLVAPPSTSARVAPVNSQHAAMRWPLSGHNGTMHAERFAPERPKGARPPGTVPPCVIYCSRKRFWPDHPPAERMIVCRVLLQSWIGRSACPSSGPALGDLLEPGADLEPAPLSDFL